MNHSMREYEKYNKTFSGTDMIVTIAFPNAKPIMLGELSTISYSIYREKKPVRTCGHINTRGFTKGPRTVAGTLIFTVMDKHIVNSLRHEIPYLKNINKIKTDELPPFNIYITMANEYGASAKLNIYGLTIVDEGKVMSVEDLFTENQWSYMARDIDLMDEIGSEQNTPITDFVENIPTGAFEIDNLIGDSVYNKMKKETDSIKDKAREAIKKARENAIKKYISNSNDLEYHEENEEFVPPPWVDPDKEDYSGLKGITYKYNDYTPKNDKNRIVIVKAELLRDWHVDPTANGIPTTISLWDSDGKELTSKTAQLKNGEIVFEIEGYYTVKPELPQIRVRVKEDHTQGSIYYNLQSDFERVVTGNQGIKHGEDIMFSYARPNSNDQKNKDFQKDLEMDFAVNPMKGYIESLGEVVKVKYFYDNFSPGVNVPTRRGSFDTGSGLQAGFLIADIWESNGVSSKTHKLDDLIPQLKLEVTNLSKTLTRSQMKDITIKAPIKIVVNLNKQYVVDKNTNASRYTIDGEHANGNILNLINSAVDQLKSEFEYPLSDILDSDGYVDIPWKIPALPKGGQQTSFNYVFEAFALQYKELDTITSNYVLRKHLDVEIGPFRAESSTGNILDNFNCKTKKIVFNIEALTEEVLKSYKK